MKAAYLQVLPLLCCCLTACNDNNNNAGNGDDSSGMTAQRQLENARTTHIDRLSKTHAQAIAGNFSGLNCLSPSAGDFDDQDRLTQTYIDTIQTAREAGTDCN